MENLWTPWRMAYIRANKDGAGCLFCTILQPSSDRRYILQRGRFAFLILNIYPYTPGHLMAVPYRHADSLGRLRPQELEELLQLAARAEMALVEAYASHEVQGGVNVGRCAGAGVEGHVHIHLVPRRRGDGRRSRELADSEELPESLDETLRRLQAALQQHASRG